MADTIRRLCTVCSKRVAVYPNTGRLYPHGSGGSGCDGSGKQVSPPRPKFEQLHCDHCGVIVFMSHVWDETCETWVPTTSVRRLKTDPQAAAEI